MTIPSCAGPYATLPAGRHKATFAEIYERFVVQAPFRERRELIFRAVELHADIVRTRFTDARIWLDGGFTTHKTWAEPEDADVVVVVPEVQYLEYTKAQDESLLPLITLRDVSATRPPSRTGKLHPMGGLMDVFVQPDADAPLAVWDTLWSSVKNQFGEVVPGVTKGYLEVEL